MRRLTPRTVVVTGAGAGLGLAVALAFARDGASVTAVSINSDELASLDQTAAAEGLAIEIEQADVADPVRTQALADAVHARHGHVDVLVNNAGIIIVKPIEETSVEEFDRVLATNLRGVFLYCRAFLGPMRAHGAGTIINVSSSSGVRGFVGESAYCPSKFGLEGLTRTLALELAGSGVRVVSVTPGAPMHTPMSETTYDEQARASWLDPSELAPGFLALAASDGELMSGGRYDAYLAGTTGVAAARDGSVTP